MKKLIAMALALVMVLSMTACNAADNKETQIENALEALNTVWAAFPEDSRFPCGGGSDMTMDAPGTVRPTDTDTLTYALNVPSALHAQITDAASLVHMMNANTFTAGAYKISGEVDAFAATLKDGIQNTQWMCGFPELLLIASVGDCVIAVYGKADLVNTFKTQLEAAYPSVNVAFLENLL